MRNGKRSAIVLLAPWLLSPLSFYARAQETPTQFEIGIVYYADGGGFRALHKEKSSEGWEEGDYSGWVAGAHATTRLPADQPQTFRVCDVDPTRFKLYKFKSKRNVRVLTISKTMWGGQSEIVLSQSEIPLKIQAVGAACFSLTPQNTLGEGEYGFSPESSLDAFMFGVGDVSKSKKK